MARSSSPHHQLHQHQQPAQRDRCRAAGTQRRAAWAWPPSPGSRPRSPRLQAVELYLQEAGLLEDLEIGLWHRRLCLHHLQRHERRADPPFSRKSPSAASTPRPCSRATCNFDRRIHPMPTRRFGQPPLVVAYALAGTVPLISKTMYSPWSMARGAPRDLWPSDAEIDAVVAPPSARTVPRRVPAHVQPAQKRCRTAAPQYAWPAWSTHPPPAVLGHRGAWARWQPSTPL